MEQFDLKKSTDKLLSEFESVSYKGIVAVLEWFYNALNYKSIFESKEIALGIHNKLSNRGFREVIGLTEEVNCFKKLMQRTDDEYEQRVGYYLIALIMQNLKEQKPLSKSLEQFICIYNETYNKENTFEAMMNNLTEAIGKDVVFITIIHGKLVLLTGVLQNVDPYHTVTINDEKYPFIGVQTEISKITDTSTGKVLYNNARASVNDNLVYFNDIEKKCMNLFGAKYKEPQKSVL